MFKEKPTKNNLDLKEEAKYREALVLKWDQHINDEIDKIN